MAQNPPRRRWLPRFSLRTLLVLTTLVFVGLVMVKTRVDKARLQRELLAAIQEEGQVRFDWETSLVAEERRAPDRRLFPPTRTGGPSGPDWLRSRLGDEFFQRITDVNLGQSGLCYSLIPVVGGVGINGAAGMGTVRAQLLSNPLAPEELADRERIQRILKLAGELGTLRRLYCLRRRVSDPMLEPLRNSPLEEVDLSGTEITGEGLHYLEDASRLKWLSLSGTEVTDAALFHLRNLSRLETLDLSNTKITARRLRYLKDLKNLKHLDLSNCQLGEHLSQLSLLTSLEELNVSYWEDSEEYYPTFDLSVLAPLTNLRKLKLCGADPRNLNALAAPTRLDHLDLSFTQLTDTDLEDIGKLKSLKELDLSQCESITIDGIRTLIEGGLKAHVDLVRTEVTKRDMLKLREEMPWVAFSRFGSHVPAQAFRPARFEPLIGVDDKLPYDYKRPFGNVEADPFGTQDGDPFAPDPFAPAPAPKAGGVF